MSLFSMMEHVCLFFMFRVFVVRLIFGDTTAVLFHVEQHRGPQFHHPLRKYLFTEYLETEFPVIVIFA